MAEPRFTYLYVPSENEQKAISIIMVISAMFSFVGSSCIIYNVRKNSKRSPYRRIMLGISVTDIVSTIGYALQPYISLRGEPSSFVWAFGNAASCSFIGALAQFGISAHLYSAALSFYFLSTIRYGTREATFAKKYERWIHGVILSWSIITPIVGVALDVFYLNDLGPGCWVSGHPFGECTGFRCWAMPIGWVMGGIPTLFSFFSILINNLLLYCYVRQTVREGQRKAMENEKRMSSYAIQQAAEGSTLSTNTTERNSEKASSRSRSVLTSSDKQWKRVREVGKQSFLYVGAYLLSFFWTIVKQALDGQQFERSEGSGAYLLPLSILQAIFLPAQGLFNACIYFRPKYKQARQKYGNETRFWIARKAVVGESTRVETNRSSRGSGALGRHKSSGGSTTTTTPGRSRVNDSATEKNRRVSFAGGSSIDSAIPDIPEEDEMDEPMSEFLSLSFKKENS